MRNLNNSKWIYSSWFKLPVSTAIEPAIDETMVSMSRCIGAPFYFTFSPTIHTQTHTKKCLQTNPKICFLFFFFSLFRFLIARSCEDICCRKRTITKKFTATDFSNYTSNYRQCEIANLTYNSNVNNLRIKSLVQIFSTAGKKFVCLGSLVHPRAVLTTLECVSA